MSMWLAWRDNGILPGRGGWMEQELNIIVAIRAIDLVVRTFRDKNKKDYDWNKFTATQKALIAWFDG